MPFEFIDNTSIDGATRKKIRTQAAKGHNVGRVLLSRRKKTTLPVPAHLKKRSQAALSVDGVDSTDPTLRISRTIGDDFSVCWLEADSTSASRSLVLRVFSFLTESIFPREMFPDFLLKEAGFMWVELVSRDEACFHCNAALSVVAVDPSFAKQENANVAIRHWSMAIRLVSDRLSGKEALTNSTIAIIVSMTHYDRLRGEYKQGIVHFDGLRRIVALRGGIAEFTRTWPRMAQKIFRADLEFALHSGKRTRYHFQDVQASHNRFPIRSLLNEAQKEDSSDNTGVQAQNQELQEVFVDAKAFAWLLNSHAWNRIPMDIHILHEIILQQGFRLLQIFPLDEPRPISFVDDVLHTGLLSFIVTFLISLGRRLPRYMPFCKRAQFTARLPIDQDRNHRKLFFWMLFIGRAAVFGEQDEEWLTTKVLETANLLNIRSWEEAEQILLKFPWYSPFHGKQGRALWEKSILLPDSTTAARNDSFQVGIQDVFEIRISS